MLPDSYLATTARRMGVPEMWIEDTIQDMRVAMWQHPDAPEKRVAHNKAVDAVRHHCGDRRKKHARVQVGYLDEAFKGTTTDFTGEVITAIDCARLIERLPPYMQREVNRVLADLPPKSASAYSLARKRARELAS